MIAGEGILGANAIPGDPGSLQGLVARLQSAATNVASIEQRLSSNSLSGSWTGQASDAFRNHLNELPGELGKIRSSFDEAAGAIGSFAAKLTGQQQTADWLATKLEQAQQAEREADTAHQTASHQLTDARQTRDANSDPTRKSTLERAVDVAAGVAAKALASLEDAGGEIQQLQAQAARNHAEWDDAAKACAAAVDAACGAQVAHSFFGWVENTLKNAGEHIADNGVAFLRRGARDAVEEFDKEWGGVRNVLSDLATRLGYVALVCAFVPGVGDVAMLGLGLASLGLSAVVLAGDEGMALQGKKKYTGDLTGDGVNVLLNAIPMHGALKATDESVDAVRGIGRAAHEAPWAKSEGLRYLLFKSPKGSTFRDSLHIYNRWGAEPEQLKSWAKSGGGGALSFVLGETKVQNAGFRDVRKAGHSVLSRVSENPQLLQVAVPRRLAPAIP